ncbi:MAG: hypothetical protein ACQEP6_01680 [Patescibacteria group bacterium]
MRKYSSITGVEDNHYKDKIQEIREREMPTVALFLERFYLNRERAFMRS